MNMAVNFGEIKRIDIIVFLDRIGIRPVRNYQAYALFHAPYREDRHPSFKVSRKKNRWYDLATMCSGDIIDLGKMLYNTNDIMEVVRRIQDYTAAELVIRERIPSELNDERAGTFRDVSVKTLSNSKLLAYLGSRGIDNTVAAEFCREIHFSLGCRHYYGIGFGNVRGGYEVRNPFFKGTVGQKDVSLIQMGNGNELCTVFEGFMDFLSYMTLCRRTDFTPFAETMDFVVLNSVSNLRKAMKWLAPYPTVTCCLDNDDAGRRAVDILSESRDGVHDASAVYEGYKDLNDFLRGKRFCP